MIKVQFDKFEQFYKKHSKEIENKILSNNTSSDEIDISSSYKASKYLLGNYVTLDYKHAFDIIEVIRKIENYANDNSINRPLNFVMIANPGIGKSHFIKCLALRMKNQYVKDITFNLANFEKNDDFLSPIEEVRNIKISDKLPLLFIDEFDSNPQNYSRLLPLMWDGELFFGDHALKLGKIVIILAGSNERIKKINNSIQYGNQSKLKIPQKEKKLIDLLSRINGGSFTIPSLDYKRNDSNRKVDKICITISLFQKRFGEKANYIPLALLKFIAETTFVHSVRSISYFLDLIPSEKMDGENTKINDEIIPHLNDEKLFRNSILSHHIKHNKRTTIIRIVNRWKKLIENHQLVKVKEEEEKYWDIDKLDKNNIQ